MKIYHYQTSIYKFDASSNHVFEIDKILKEHICDTQIIADDFDSSLPYNIKLVKDVKITKDDLMLVHFGIGKDFFDTIDQYPCKKIMIYHNFTPPHFAPNALARVELKKASIQLTQLGNKFDAVMTDSEFNALDLKKNNYKNIIVIPFLRDFSYLAENKFNEKLATTLQHEDAIIFIGRISPNKKQADLAKAFYFYKKYFNNKSKLYIIGGYGSTEPAFLELQNVIHNLNLTSDVVITGKISDSDMITYLKYSKLFLSMSEHEGFCVPVVESMFYSLPVLAYSKGGAIADTTGKGGLLFNEKNFFEVACLIDEMISNQELRNKIIANQKIEIENYNPEKIKSQIWNFLVNYIK